MEEEKKTKRSKKTLSSHPQQQYQTPGAFRFPLPLEKFLAQHFTLEEIHQVYTTDKERNEAVLKEVLASLTKCHLRWTEDKTKVDDVTRVLTTIAPRMRHLTVDAPLTTEQFTMICKMPQLKSLHCQHLNDGEGELTKTNPIQHATGLEELVVRCEIDDFWRWRQRYIWAHNMFRERPIKSSDTMDKNDQAAKFRLPKLQRLTLRLESHSTTTTLNDAVVDWNQRFLEMTLQCCPNLTDLDLHVDLPDLSRFGNVLKLHGQQIQRFAVHGSENQDVDTMLTYLLIAQAHCTRLQRFCLEGISNKLDFTRDLDNKTCSLKMRETSFSKNFLQHLLEATIHAGCGSGGWTYLEFSIDDAKRRDQLFDELCTKYVDLIPMQHLCIRKFKFTNERLLAWKKTHPQTRFTIGTFWRDPPVTNFEIQPLDANRFRVRFSYDYKKIDETAAIFNLSSIYDQGITELCADAFHGDASNAFWKMVKALPPHTIEVFARSTYNNVQPVVVDWLTPTSWTGRSAITDINSLVEFLASHQKTLQVLDCCCYSYHADPSHLTSFYQQLSVMTMKHQLRHVLLLYIHDLDSRLVTALSGLETLVLHHGNVNPIGNKSMDAKLQQQLIEQNPNLKVYSNAFWIDASLAAGWFRKLPKLTHLAFYVVGDTYAFPGKKCMRATYKDIFELVQACPALIDLTVGNTVVQGDSVFTDPNTMKTNNEQQQKNHDWGYRVSHALKRSIPLKFRCISYQEWEKQYTYHDDESAEVMECVHLALDGPVMDSAIAESM